MRVTLQNGGCDVGDIRYMTEGCGLVGGRPFVDIGISRRTPNGQTFAAMESVRLYLSGRSVPDSLDADDLVRRVQRQRTENELAPEWADEDHWF